MLTDELGIFATLGTVRIGDNLKMGSIEHNENA